MQLRFESPLTFEEYVTGRGWEQATLEACPLCPPVTCHLQRLAPYMRKVPAVAFVARYYCPEQHTTFGLLPDFYASRMPGTLDEIEQAVETAEKAGGIERAAEQLRPADAPDAVTLGAAVAWLRRRLAMVYALLGTVACLFPDLFAGMGTCLRAWRERLGTARVLVVLRKLCARHLYALPPPLGLNPRAPTVAVRGCRRQQCMGPDPPPGGL